jgi:hypothetical protein
LGLCKYITKIIYGDMYRHLLLFSYLKSYDAQFIYFDDRLDNIECIKEHFINSKTVHVVNPLILYKLV